jgi:small-conductance mechanosensitive channel
MTGVDWPALPGLLGLLRLRVFDNALGAWLAAILLGLLFLGALVLLKNLLLRRLRAAADRTPTRVDDLIVLLLAKTRPYVLLLIAFYLAAHLLPLTGAITRLVSIAAVVAVLVQLAIWGDALVRLSVARYTQQVALQDLGRAATVAAIGFMGRLLLWSLLVLLVLDNVGVNVTALVAGLGIGGIAVALAVQNILGDLFASLSIMLDKPFVAGDFITVDAYMGNVEYIGIKTTRLRSLSGEQIVFSNADLLRSRIRNYQRMAGRRVEFVLSVTYENPPHRLELVPRLLREIIEAQAQARLDRAFFKGFRDFALDFEVAYFIDSADYHVFVDTQQAVNVAIFRRFHERGIEFAHQGTAHTQKLPAAQAAHEGTP